MSARSRASLPDAQEIACGTSSIRASSASRSVTSGPSTNLPESQTRVIAAWISLRSTAYWRSSASRGTDGRRSAAAAWPPAVEEGVAVAFVLCVVDMLVCNS